MQAWEKGQKIRLKEYCSESVPRKVGGNTLVIEYKFTVFSQFVVKWTFT